MSDVTYHLVPAEYYRDTDRSADYTPEPFELDGFIHTTNDLAEVAKVGNRYYKSDQRMYVVLVIAIAKIRERTTVEDPGGLYPHIHGPLNRDAIIGIVPVLREADGSFRTPRYDP